MSAVPAQGQFDRLNVWSRGGQRAPHKPLLVLYALGRWARADPTLFGVLATRLLENHFPESLHPDILAAVGLDLGAPAPAGRKRDPQFRQRVLTAYEYRCAVCGFDVRLGSVPIALDAAHIRWHQAGGPDREGNGLALCVLHHKTFDLGAFTLSPAGVLLVSDQATAPPASRRPCCATTARASGRPSDRITSPRPPSWTGTAARCSRGRRGTWDSPVKGQALWERAVRDRGHQALEAALMDFGGRAARPWTGRPGSRTLVSGAVGTPGGARAGA
jgi:HNH endonuclease